MLEELNEWQEAALDAVVAADAAWSTWSVVRLFCGDANAEALVAGGWLEVWADPGLEGVHVTLTPGAAERLWVELDEPYEFKRPRWFRCRAGTFGSVWGEWGKIGDGWPIKAARYPREVPLGRAELVPDEDDAPGEVGEEPEAEPYLVEEVDVEEEVGGELVVRKETRRVLIMGREVRVDGEIRGKK